MTDVELIGDLALSGLRGSGVVGFECSILLIGVLQRSCVGLKGFVKFFGYLQLINLHKYLAVAYFCKLFLINNKIYINLNKALYSIHQKSKAKY